MGIPSQPNAKLSPLSLSRSLCPSPATQTTNKAAAAGASPSPSRYSSFNVLIITVLYAYTSSVLSTAQAGQRKVWEGNDELKKNHELMVEGGGVVIGDEYENKHTAAHV